MCSEANKETFFKEICDFPIPSYDDWRKAVDKSLKGAPFAKLLTKTYEDILLHPMYQMKDIEQLEFIKSAPGQFPFVRGTSSSLNSWLVAQEMNHPLPQILNEWLKNDLQKGVNAINIVLNEKIKLQVASSDVQPKGAFIVNVEDLETVFKDIDVQNYPFLIQAGANTSFVRLVAAFFEKNHLSLSELKGCIGTDPLAMLLQEGSLPRPLTSYLEEMAETIKWKEEKNLQLKTILIDGNCYHNGGANSVQELAYMVATAVFYMRELQKYDLSVDQIAASISFSLSIGSNMFMELAKIRSCRMLWANVVLAFGGNEESQKLDIHAKTSEWTKTVYDPYVNMLRGTVEAFTAAIGGVTSLHVSPFDEPFALPTEFSRRIARNAQLILKEEALLTKTSDPAGGSWYIEKLTDEVTTKSWSLFQQVEEVGGIDEAIQKGMPQKEIEIVASKKNEDIQKRRLIFVGATMYPNKEDHYHETKDSSLATEQNNRSAMFEQNECQTVTINEMIQDFINGKNLATYSQSNEVIVKKIKPYRATEAFELLRQCSEKRKQAGKPVNVFLTNIGPLAHHKQRSDFVRSFFETGGFDVMNQASYRTIEEAVSATLSSGSSIAVLCGKNEGYAETAVQIVTQILEKCPEMKIFVAGKQEEELEQQLLNAGVSGFIHIGTNCYQLLHELQGEKEVLVND